MKASTEVINKYEMFNIKEIFDAVWNEDEDIEFIKVIEAPRHDRVFKPKQDNLNLWTDEEFLKIFRLSKQTLRVLLNEIEANLIRILQFWSLQKGQKGPLQFGYFQKEVIFWSYLLAFIIPA